MTKFLFAMFSIIMFWSAIDYIEEKKYFLGGFWLGLSVLYMWYEIVPTKEHVQRLWKKVVAMCR